MPKFSDIFAAPSDKPVDQPTDHPQDGTKDDPGFVDPPKPGHDMFDTHGSTFGDPADDMA